MRQVCNKLEAQSDNEPGRNIKSFSISVLVNGRFWKHICVVLINSLRIFRSCIHLFCIVLFISKYYLYLHRTDIILLDREYKIIYILWELEHKSYAQACLSHFHRAQIACTLCALRSIEPTQPRRSQRRQQTCAFMYAQIFWVHMVN